MTKLKRKTWRGETRIASNFKPSQNSRRQKDDVNQVPYRGLTNIRRQRTKFSRHGDRTPGDCALVLATLGV